MERLVGHVHVFVAVADHVDRPGELALVLAVSAYADQVVCQPFGVIKRPDADDCRAVVPAEDVQPPLVSDGHVEGEIRDPPHAERLQKRVAGSQESIGSSHIKPPDNSR